MREVLFWLGGSKTRIEKVVLAVPCTRSRRVARFGIMMLFGMTRQSLVEFTLVGELGRGPRQHSQMEIQFFSVSTNSQAG